MLIIIKNSYIIFCYTLLFFSFIINIIEDILHKEVYIYLTFIEIILLLIINIFYLKVIFIYIFFAFLYFIFSKYFKNHIGFGDIWYLILYFYHLPHINYVHKFFTLYKSLLIILLLYILIEKKIPKTISFLPVIGGAFLINLLFLYKIKVF
jgi:hypothetical protein